MSIIPPEISPELGQLFYKIWQSPWHHPGVCFVLGGVLGVLVPWLRPFSGREEKSSRALLFLFLILQIEIWSDAALTGSLSPIKEGSLAATVAASAFVLLGDLRYFYVIERQRDLDKKDLSRRRALFTALRWALPLPLFCGVAHKLAGDALAGNRLFLLYEVLFQFVMTLHRRTRGALAAGTARYVFRIVLFERLQYGLWAVADVLILGGSALGFLLRMVPDALYYAGFVPLVILTAPKEARA